MAKSHVPSSNSNKKEAMKRNASGKDRSAVVSLTQFAHHKSKGTKKAIEHYRNKQQSKFNRRAGLLRQYKKAMKSEGFEAGVGGSRKRVPDGGEGSSSSENVTKTDADPQDTATSTTTTTTTTTKGRAKADPFFKSKQKAQKSKEEKLQRQRDAEEWKKQKEIKLKKRAQRSKLMSKRTRKGQPVMRNMIESMLEKIKRDE